VYFLKPKFHLFLILKAHIKAHEIDCYATASILRCVWLSKQIILLQEKNETTRRK
jgi:hypothetical protein